jgi:acetate kinase
MKRLLASDSPDSRLSVELYCYRAKKYIGAYAAALGGIDAIIFGGGVGENAPVIRRKVLEGMGWCGIEIDDSANDITIGKEGRISSSGSSIDVWVIPVDEAGLLAEEAAKVVNRI